MAEAKEKTPLFDGDGKYVGPSTMTINFASPLRMHEKDPNQVAAINLQEPTIEQFAAFEDELAKTKNNFNAGALLISKVAGIQLPLAKKIGVGDFARAMEFLTGFIPPGQEITGS